MDYSLPFEPLMSVRFPLDSPTSPTRNYSHSIVLTAAHCKGAFLAGVEIGGNKVDGTTSTMIAVDSEHPNPLYSACIFNWATCGCFLKFVFTHLRVFPFCCRLGKWYF